MKKLVLSSILVLTGTARPYGARPEHIEADSVWLESLQEKYRIIDSVFAEVSWDFFTTGVWPDIPEKYYKMQQETVLSRYSLKKYDRIQGEFGSPEMNRMAREMYLRLHRQRNSFFPDYRGLGPSLIRTIINYRPIFEGQDRSRNQLLRILRNETDSERRKLAWIALNEVGEIIAPELMGLIRERNRVARDVGFDNYYQLQVLPTGINDEDLFEILAELDLITEEPYAQIMDRRKLEIGSDNSEPWDFSYSGGASDFLAEHFPSDSLISILYRTMSGLGYDLSDSVIHFDLESRPGKYQNSVCFPVNIPDDIRVLANIDDGPSSYMTVFHEVGHALYLANIDQHQYILRSPSSDCFSEAMAAINESMITQKEWLEEYASIPKERIRAVMNSFKDSEIINMRFLLATVYFERELYRTNAENPAELYWDILSRFTGCLPHCESNAWAAIPHLTTYPVYVHNYILAKLIAAQTVHYLNKSFGSVIDDKAVSEFLIEHYFKPGASKDWSELVEETTGEPLKIEYFIEDLLSR